MNGTKIRIVPVIAAMLLSMSLCGLVRAQAASHGSADGAVTGVGTGSIERRPELLRMQVEISADGKDAKDALENLKKQESSAREKLGKLGAIEKEVKLADTQVAMPNRNDPRGQMERMIRARTGKGGKGAPTTAPAPMVHVTAKLTAEWALKAEGADDLVVEATDLQAKIKAAAVVAPAAGGKSPEEEEEAEEGGGGNNFGMQNDGQPMPGEAIYLYVSKLSEEDRSKAAADAYKRAKTDAGRLAKAAGSELGELRQLTSSNGDFNRYDNYDYNGRMAQIYAAMQQQQQMVGEDAEPNLEAIGMQPGKVAYRVIVSASFAIKGQ